MKKIIATMLVPFIFTACAQTGGGAATHATKRISHALSAYHWMLDDARTAQGERIGALFVNAEKPLQLDFDEGRFRISQTCNAIVGQLVLREGTLEFGAGLSTKKMCEARLMQQEQSISQLLRGTLGYVLHVQAPARLHLSTSTGDTLLFVGKATAQTRYGGTGEIVFLEVASATKPCQHGAVKDAQCLQVRERRYDKNGLPTGEPGPWQDFHDNIEGYTHQAGVRHILRLKRYPVQNPVAGGPDAAYVLDMVVSTTVEK